MAASNEDIFANNALFNGYNYIASSLFYKSNPIILGDPNTIYSTNLELARWGMEESIFGESDEQYKINDWYWALLYSYLFWRNIAIYGETLEDTKDEFDYDCIKKCFGCKNIPLDTFLGFFGIVVLNGVLDTSEGIEHIGFEESFEIEPDEIDVVVEPSYTLEELLDSSGCTWSIEDHSYSSQTC